MSSHKGKARTDSRVRATAEVSAESSLSLSLAEMRQLVEAADDLRLADDVMLNLQRIERSYVYLDTWYAKYARFEGTPVVES
jgi:hypothetical protein